MYISKKCHGTCHKVKLSQSQELLRKQSGRWDKVGFRALCHQIMDSLIQIQVYLANS